MSSSFHSAAVPPVLRMGHADSKKTPEQVIMDKAMCHPPALKAVVPIS
jgi:hypothetical protein